MTAGKKVDNAPSAPDDPTDAIERAKALILAGAVSTDDTTSHAYLASQFAERDLESYFWHMKGNDINADLTLLEFSADPDDIQAAVKRVSAYLHWADVNGVETSPDGLAVTLAAIRFALAISRRLTGKLTADGEVIQTVRPDWQRPDHALGWTHPPHRVADTNLKTRNEGIVAMWAKLDRQKVSELDRLHRIGTAFKVARSSIYAVLQEYRDFQTILGVTPTDDELNNLIKKGKLSISNPKK